jgi:hypothetical protein
MKHTTHVKYGRPHNTHGITNACRVKIRNVYNDRNKILLKMEGLITPTTTPCMVAWSGSFTARWWSKLTLPEFSDLDFQKA